MNPHRLFGVALLALGSLGLWFGLLATGNLGERFEQGFTGWYTQRTTWYLVGGTVAVLVGATLAFARSRRTHA